MAYKPSRDPALDREPFASMQRMHDSSRQALAEAGIVGKTVEDARKQVEAVGLTFRPVEADGVQTADWCATRVTATVVGGIVQHAEVR